jgi:transcriptional regulator with XRE-family HTH domain
MNPTCCQNGAEIRRLREESLGISVAALAARVGIKRQSLCNIELGNKPAGLQTLIKIAAELGVPVDQIIRPRPAPVPLHQVTAAKPTGAAA